MASGKEFPLSIILRTVDRATAPLDKFSRNLDRIGKSAARLGKSLTTSLTLPIVAIGAAGVKAMSDFEDGMAKVGTLIDTTGESLDEMGAEVRAIGRRTPVALSDLTAALYSVRSAGVSAADQFSVLERSAQLGVAGMSTTAEAVDIVTSSMNAFNLKGADAVGISDVLFTAVKHGKTDLSQLGQGFGAVAGKMADAGIEFDEYMASVTAMTTVGRPASQAHTQMRAAIDGLTKSSKPLSKIFRRLGAKDFQDLIQKSGGVVPAMMKVRDAVGGSEAKMRALIGSSEGSAAVMSVTGTTYQAFTETLDDMRDGVSEVDKKFEEMNDTTASSLKRTKNAATSAAISIGKVLAPTLEKVSSMLEGLSGWFEGLDESTKEWIVTVAGVAAVVGPALMIFGKVAAAIKTITFAMRLLSKAMLASPFGVIILGLEAISLLTGDDWGTMFSTAIEFWKEKIGEFLVWLADKYETAVMQVDDLVSWATGTESIRDKRNREQAEKFKAEQDAEKLSVVGGNIMQMLGDIKQWDTERLGGPRFFSEEPKAAYSGPWMGKDGLMTMDRPDAAAPANGKVEIVISGQTQGVRATVKEGDGIDLFTGIPLLGGAL